MLSDSLRRPASWPRLLTSVDARIAPVGLPLAAYSSLRAGKLCICMCNTVCGIRGYCRRDATAFRRLAGRSRCLDCQPGDRFWGARLSDRAKHFPLGGAIGTAALIATVVSAQVLRRLPAIGRPAELALALLAAYVAYEVVLFALTPVLGGAGAFTVAIIARIGLLNVLWMIGLVLAYQLLKLFVLKQQQLVS
jgi:hypothetical protein